MQNTLQRLSELEGNIHWRQRAPAGQAAYTIELGTIPILISAPHAAHHVRNSVSKFEEEYTAAIAQYLAQELGCYAIYLRYASPTDPNWDAESTYKKAIADLVGTHAIKVVLDLHGMVNRHRIGVALGTINGRSFPTDTAMLLTPFAQAGFIETDLTTLNTTADSDWRRVILNHPRFTGGTKGNTITRFVSEDLGALAVQIELASAIRIVYRAPTAGWNFHYWGDPAGIRLTLQALTALVKTLHTSLE